jgi:hypothetical protein
LLDTIALGAYDDVGAVLKRHSAGNVALCRGATVVSSDDGRWHDASATNEIARATSGLAIIYSPG